MRKRFIVDYVVCDYGVFDTKLKEDEQLKCICMGRRNADLIADILNTDYSKPNECTYYENELQQENKQLKEQHELLIDEFQKERENLCKQIKQESDARERFVKEVKRLEEQLAEKDKEINTIKQLLESYKQQCHYFVENEENIRKQVCNEIREKIRTRIEAYPIICEDENKIVKRCIFIDTIKDILNNIEQGEQQ